MPATLSASAPASWCGPRATWVASRAAERQSAAANGRYRVVFEGLLDTRDELRRSLLGSGSADESPAALVLKAYETHGAAAVQRLRGSYACVVWDGPGGEVTAFRDHLGLHPLFWTAAGESVKLASSVDALLAEPDVSRTLNRAALADHLAHRWPDKDETCFAAIRRVPPGHALKIRAAGSRVDRYWHPGEPGRTAEWVRDEELARFDALFEQAVARAVGGSRTAVSLSGGLDSISVATVASDLAARGAAHSPIAVSLAFPEGESNEEQVQRAIAVRLGFEHVVLPILEATAPLGILRASLDTAATRGAPPLSPWCSAYARLLDEARARGVGVVLTGNGGDEWMTVTPYVAADLLASGDLGGLGAWAAAAHRSFRVSWPDVARSFVRFGVRPLVSRQLHRTVPGPWHRNRHRRVWRTTPPWVAPEPGLRRELEGRAARGMTNADPPGGFYLQELRSALDHPLVAWETEESFETAHKAGLVYRHPYLDVDLVEFLFRTPPRALNRDGRSKGLVRETVSRRYPGLGFDRQKKVAGTGFYQSLLVTEGPVEWTRLGGPRRLAELGVVDLDRASETAEKIFDGSLSREVHRVWDLLGLEAWVRAWG